MSSGNSSMRGTSAWLIATGVALVSWSCGSSDAPGFGSGSNIDGGAGTSGNSQGNGGSGAVTSSNGGAGPGAGGAGNGGSAGTGPASVSMRAACRAYLMAGCIRRSECGANTSSDIGGALSCAETLLDRCPDYTFSPGSARTAAALFACADDWKTWSCVKVVEGVSPPCGLPGTRKAGEPCVFPSQCESLSCSSNGNPTTCGTCRGVAPSGGPCDVNTICPDGESCMGTRCVAQPPPTPTEVTVPLRRPGEACTFGDQCWSDSSCIASDPNDGRIGRCTAPALPGEPCSKLAGSGGRTTCWLEGSCGADGLCAAQTACTNGLTCTTPQFCACSAGSCTCRRPREEGASCAPPDAPCAAGLECRGGTCVATDALTRYTSACGGP